MLHHNDTMAKSTQDLEIMVAAIQAYVFALSQFFMAWILAALYLRAAGRFDEMAKEVVNKSRRE